MKRAISLFFLVFLYATLAFAQSEVPALPTMEELFAEGVVAEVVPPVVSPPSTRPYTDDSARIVYVFDEDTETWQEYPYPDEIESFSGIDSYNETTLLLSTIRNRGPYGTAPDPTKQWLLDIDTGEYWQPETVCGELRAEEGSGWWIAYYEDYPDTPAYLCNIETGELLGPLPEDQYWEHQSAIPSPDGERLIVFAGFSIYSYHFETEALTILGTPQLTDFRNTQWIGNDLVFISAANQGDMTYPWRQYYLADPAEADSMTPIATIIKPAYITHLDNPPRYEWIQSWEDGCYLAQLNTETGELNEYDLQELCSQGYRLPDGTGDGDRLFYDIIWLGENFAYWDEIVRLLYLPDSLPISSQLVRLDPYTGERTDLYSGEIEWLREVTSNGQYAVLLVDDSGVLDMIAARKTQEEIESHPRWVILDIQTGEPIYEVPTSWEFDPGGYFLLSTWNHEVVYTIPSINEMGSNMRRLPSSSLFSVGNELFLHVELTGERGNWQRSDTLIQIQDGNSIEHQMTGEIALVMPNSRYVVFWADGAKNSTAVSVYDIETGITTPIILGEPAQYAHSDDVNSFTEAYSLSLSASSEGSALSIRLCPRIRNDYDCSQSITYRVELGE